jgi:hypothetical protein
MNPVPLVPLGMAPFSSDGSMMGPWGVGRSLLRGLAWRIGATAAFVVGGFVFVLLYLAFWAGRYAWYQNLAVVVSVAAIVPTAVILLWIAWALSMGRRFSRPLDV